MHYSTFIYIIDHTYIKQTDSAIVLSTRLLFQPSSKSCLQHYKRFKSITCTFIFVSTTLFSLLGIVALALLSMAQILLQNSQVKGISSRTLPHHIQYSLNVAVLTLALNGPPKARKSTYNQDRL